MRNHLRPIGDGSTIYRPHVEDNRREARRPDFDPVWAGFELQVLKPSIEVIDDAGIVPIDVDFRVGWRAQNTEARMSAPRVPAVVARRISVVAGIAVAVPRVPVCVRTDAQSEPQGADSKVTAMGWNEDGGVVIHVGSDDAGARHRAAGARVTRIRVDASTDVRPSVRAARRVPTAVPAPAVAPASVLGGCRRSRERERRCRRHDQRADWRTHSAPNLDSHP